MLQIKNLTASYSDKEILHNISFTCEKGTLTTLTGPNGCGKSTLLKAVTGLVPDIRGTIELNGIPVSSIPQNILAQNIAYLSQGKNIPDISVFRMVLHGRFPYLSYPRRYRKSDYEAAQLAMEKMGIADIAEKELCVLSGGTRQKVYIAMALCQQAEIIMLDEPMTYLDIHEQFKLNAILKELSMEGKTILCVSHDIISALKNSDRIAVMQEGKLKASGSPEEILNTSVIPEVFSVGIDTVEKNGRKEYFYKAEE